MIPTVAEVLDFEPVRVGRPRVVAGGGALDNPVRWVHISELVKIEHLLRGGELLLTTGIALPDDPAGLWSYVRDVAHAGASGLLVELGNRYTTDVPTQMAKAAAHFGLPLVVFDKQVQFVRITEVVHARIVADQLQDLRLAERLDNAFTALVLQGKSATEVVAEASRLTGIPVVLEDLSHRVLACEAAGRGVGELLDEWARRSRATHLGGRTGYDPQTGLLASVVGTPRGDWGRLLFVSGREPTAQETKFAERASNTLALCRLTDPQSDPYKDAQHEILARLLRGAYTSRDLAARVESFGVPLDHGLLVGLAVRPSQPVSHHQSGDRAELASLEESLTHAAWEASVPILAAAFDVDLVALLGVTASVRIEPVLTGLAMAVRCAAHFGLSIGAGSVAESYDGAFRSLVEARDAAAMAPPSRTVKPYHDLNDIGLRGLLYLLRGDVRLQTFLERQIGPLLAYDASHPDDSLLDVIGAFVSSRGNTTATAKALKLSRPTVYERLHHIERVLNVDLTDPERLTAIHVALLAYQDV